MTATANDMQVGGSHYASTNNYLHWDWTLDVRLGYLDGQVTKYVVRWRAKAGLQDLQKALHYNRKLIENWKRLKRTVLPAPELVRASTARLAAGIKLSAEEVMICELVAGWQTVSELYEVQDLILGLMAQIDAANADQPVLLEDSNKHADRYRGE